MDRRVCSSHCSIGGEIESWTGDAAGPRLWGVFSGRPGARLGAHVTGETHDSDHRHTGGVSVCERVHVCVSTVERVVHTCACVFVCVLVCRHKTECELVQVFSCMCERVCLFTCVL